MFPKVFAIFGYQKVVNLHKRQPFGDARCVRKDKQAHRRTDRQKEGKMEICISIQKLRQTNKQTDGQTKRWKDSPGNNNIDSSPIQYQQLYTSQGNPKNLDNRQTNIHTHKPIITGCLKIKCIFFTPMLITAPELKMLKFFFSELLKTGHLWQVTRNVIF